LGIWLFWRKQPEALPWRAEEKWLLDYIKAAAANPFTRKEAKELVELLKGTDFHNEGMAFTSAVLKEDGKDPWFRLYHELLQPFHLNRPERDRENYQSILEEATRRGDQAAAKLARELLTELDRQHPISGPPGWDELEEEFEAELDDEFEEDEDEEEEDEDSPFLFPGIPREELLTMRAIFDTMSRASLAEIGELRKNLPQGMPKEAFDQLVAMARSGLPFPEWPSDLSGAEGPSEPMRPPAKPRPKWAPKDLNQLDLF
jgi:hypothetical protein